MSLVARHLEANGIPTVVWSNARDISQAAFTPRTVFTNYPLGNPIGRPADRADQRAGVMAALDLLESAERAGTIVDTGRRWSDDTGWMRHIFSDEQPFLSEEAEARRQADLAAARRSKAP